MALVRPVAVFSIGLLVCCIFCFSTIASSAEGPRMIGVKASEVESHLKIFSEAVQRGGLELAGRDDATGFFYAWDRGLVLLEGEGISYSILAQDAGRMEFYLVPRISGIERADVAASATIVFEDDSAYLVASEPEAAGAVHALPAKQRLALPSDGSLPLRTFRPMEEIPAQRALSYSYSPAIQTLVDAVSPTNLYDRLSDLSGENQVLIGGAPYTISTRYSPTQSCRDAAAYLLEQFQALGISAEYDYYNFRKVLTEIVFPVDASDGWTIGGSALLHTYDGGQEWLKEEDGINASLTALYMFDEQTGLIGASNGKILRTEDGGVTWGELVTPTANQLNAISFPTSLIGYMCGNAGTMIKSTDGGLTWALLASGTTVDLNGVCFVSPTVGWAVGAAGLIRKTSNGGETWQSVTSPVTTELTDIAFPGQTNGIICGLSGVILRTTDGAAWQRITIPTTYSLYAVCLVGASTAWACGDNALIRSLDGGATWVSMTPAAYYQLRDVCFLDSDEGFASGNGVIIHTLDGGTSWENQAINIQAGDVNVVATLPGTVNPDEIYVICAHYDDTSQIPDTYAPGADDNGTGTIAALEAARVLCNTRLESTVKFVAFSREEQGLVGSNAYAMEAYQDGDSIVAALNFDMIGYVDIAPEDLDVIYNGISLWLAQEYQSAAAMYVPGLDIAMHLQPSFGSSDNASFWSYGYPSFCGIEDSDVPNPYYHRVTDRVSTLDFDFYTQVVKGAVASLVEMARIDSVTSSVPPVASVGRIKVGPNPSRGEVSFEMASGPGRTAVVNVYDVSGRLVRSLKAANVDGTAKATWNGDDASGTRVGAGIYFFKLEGADQATKIVLVR